MLNKDQCFNCDKRKKAPKNKESRGFDIDWDMFCKVYCPCSKKEDRNKGVVFTRENCPNA